MNGHVKFVHLLILSIMFIVKTVYKHCITIIMSMLIYLSKRMCHIFSSMSQLKSKENIVGPLMILRMTGKLMISMMTNPIKKHKNQV